MKNKKRLYIGIILLITLIILGTGYDYILKKITIDQEPIPLGIINSLDEKSKKIITDIELMELESKEILNTEVVGDINNASMALIRKDRYGFNSSSLEKLVWESYAGSLPEIYMSYLNQTTMSNELMKSVDKMTDFRDPVTSGSIDFVHLIAVTDIYVSKPNNTDYKEKCYQYLLTWGGDLESFLIDLVAFANNHQVVTFDDLYQYSYQTIGSEKRSYFSQEDFLADMDGANIAVLINDEGLLLSEALNEYYVDGLVNNRYTLFMDSFGGQDAFIEAVRSFVNDTVEAQYADNEDYISFRSGFKSVKKMMIKSISQGNLREATIQERKAISEAFVDLLVKKNKIN